ncbi:MAG: glycosyltransferase family 2 protein [Sphingomonas sp.]|uniref:glycosyltransferase family 2 protein n=1 Tax=Sphingomonas sp. TaxID=28214 RepID=UPI0025F4B94E|nr:glycosyltransferase family 2 protein [Sphingomonas sp.]MBY0284875.1 glycosyltransferase family 2 protein [Sphingomonas sp.]
MIAAITVTYNAISAGVFLKFLDSIVPLLGSNVRLIIVDNSSSDDTRNFLSNFSSPFVDVILNDVNVGFGCACNQAARFSERYSPDRFLFINNDVFLTGDPIVALSESLDSQGGGAISPVIIYADGTQKIWYEGGVFSSLRGIINYHLKQGRVRTSGKFGVARTQFAPACVFLIDRLAFEDVGGFDERFFVYWEDADLCLQLIRRGYSIYLDYEVIVEHVVSATTGGARSEFSIVMNCKNHIIFVRKNMGYLSAIFAASMSIAKWTLRLLTGQETVRNSLLAYRSVLSGLAASVG